MAGAAKDDKEPQAGARPEWKARQARKRIVGIVKTFVGVMILGVLVGLGVVYKEQLLKLLEKKEPANVTQVTPPAAPNLPLAPLQKKELPPPVPTVVTPPPDDLNKRIPPIETFNQAEDDAARSLIAQGTSLLKQFKFPEAGQLFRQAAAKKGRAKTISEAKTLENKAVNFFNAIRHIVPTDYALKDAACVIKTRDGREIAGLKLGENEHSIDVQVVNRDNPAALGKVRLQVSKLDVEGRPASLSLEARRNEFRQLLGTLESNVGDVRNSAEYYDLVFLSRRLNLLPECLEYLERAYDGGPERKPDPYVGETFRKEVVRRAISRAAMMVAAGRSMTYVDILLNDLGRTLPEFQYAQEEIAAFKMTVKNTVKDSFKSSLKEVRVAAAQRKPDPKLPPPSAKQLTNSVAENGDSVEYIVENTGVAGKGTAGPLVEQANTKYDAGISAFRKFQQGTTGNNNQNLKQALKLLEEAIDLYEQALKKDPSNKAVEDRQQEASMVAYSCRKYQTL